MNSGKKALGLILVALPFVTLFVIEGAVHGWMPALMAFGFCAFTAACAALGVKLIWS